MIGTNNFNEIIVGIVLLGFYPNIFQFPIPLLGIKTK